MEGERGDQRATPEGELKSERWRSGRRIQCSVSSSSFFFYSFTWTSDNKKITLLFCKEWIEKIFFVVEREISWPRFLIKWHEKKKKRLKTKLFSNDVYYYCSDNNKRKESN